MVELGIVFDAPIESNGIIMLDGVVSVAIQNAGTSIVTLDGVYDLTPKSTLNISVPGNASGVVLEERIRVSFSGGGTNSVQVVKTYVKGRKPYEQKTYRQ